MSNTFEVCANGGKITVTSWNRNSIATLTTKGLRIYTHRGEPDERKD
jgi:hypothetical protein